MTNIIFEGDVRQPAWLPPLAVGRTVDSNDDVVAFVERAAGSSLDGAALRAHLRDHLAPHKIPGEIRLLATLPAAPTGKLLRGVMKTMAQQPAAAADAPPQ